jgi:S1-C subfamily serine protease/predicted esterase
MAWRIASLLTVLTVWLGLIVLPAAAEEDENEGLEKAIKAAVKKVAPTVVQINTIGGTDRVVAGPRGVQIRKAIGPTTGVIVESDGYVISSAFNFINNPKNILIGVPGHKKAYPAKIVATDYSRMLTLLKISATGLPVPEAAPKKDFEVGQWSIALGRTLDPNTANVPSISVGILSALDRIWGKAVQIDPKVSPVNYGGPSVDIEGRVQGILVPASPQGDDSTAGIEWYDSGIGFAIPLEDIKAVLPRLKKGESLKRGMLGVGLPNPYDYGAKPVVNMVSPKSAAAKAGIQTGDEIIEIEGKPVERVAQLLHLIGPKYEGDTVSLTVKRAGKKITLKDLKLVSTTFAFAHSFLGIIPMRDDPELGVAIRYVYPKSPADKATLKEGDRILKVGAAQGNRPMVALNGIKSGRDQLTDLLSTASPGTEIKLEVRRKGKKDTVTLKARLDSLPDTAVNTIPDALPDADPDKPKTTFKKARDPRWTLDRTGKPVKPKEVRRPKDKDVDTGLSTHLNATRDHTYYVYVPENYDPNIAHGVLLWLHPAGKDKKEDVERFVNTWDDFANDHHFILVCPVTDQKNGWIPTESDFVLGVVRDVLTRYTVDRQRVVAHGMGVGGQMATHLAFLARDTFRGVATTGSVLTKQPHDNVAQQRLAFFIAAGDKDPLVKAIGESIKKLSDRKFPVIYRVIKNMGAQYLDDKTQNEMARWVESLDRL